MLIQTFNLQGKTFTEVKIQLTKADFYCFQEVSNATFQQLNKYTWDSGKTRQGIVKLFHADYGMYARSGTKTTAVAGHPDMVGESPDTTIIQANGEYPDVIRPMVSMEDSQNRSIVFSIHAPSGKDECAVLAVLNFVRGVSKEYGTQRWYIAGDMNTTPTMFAKSFCIKSYKPKPGVGKFVKVDPPTLTGIPAASATVFVVCVDANTHTGGRSLDYLITNDPVAAVESVGAFYTSDHLPVIFSVSDP